jgi:hypothetical protein
MTKMRSHETHGRKVIFLLVFLSHCILIFVITRWNISQKSATQSYREPLFVFFLSPNKPRLETDGPIEPSPAKARTVLKPRNSAPRASFPSAADPNATSSNAITDWYAEAHSVAEDALERDRNKGAKRAFDHKIPSAEEHEPSSIFDPLSVRRAGTWDGPDRFYVTDNCYYEWDRAARPPPTLLDNRLKTPICKAPPKGGGNEMFKDLTPDYLKTTPEPKSP